MANWKLGFGVQNEGLRAARLRSARVSVANMNHKGPQGSVRFRSSSARKELSGERERRARPCGVTVCGCIPRESPTNSNGSSRLFEVRCYVYFHREGEQSEVI
jgi:hypothetical protein